MSTHLLLHEISAILKPILNQAYYHFLLACSGGADSTALLLLFHKLQKKRVLEFSVVTVNHNIRNAADSAADALFVAKLCQQLHPPVCCFVEEIPAGVISAYAAKRKRGIEDAARFFRYQILKKKAAAIKADFIVTAHNKDDIYETVLMRLFQGGGTASLQKMPIRRGMYLRPLITTERSTIISFLQEEKQHWCEDATNAENTYLRNRIRHFLVPALATVFGQWAGGLDKTLEKIALDRSFCDTALRAARIDFSSHADWISCRHGAAAISASFFYSLAPALRLRVLEEGCLQLRTEQRVPFGILRRMAVSEPQVKIISAGSLRLESRDLRVFLFDTAMYYVFYAQKLYFLSIYTEGRYIYPLGQLIVYKKTEGFFVKDNCDTGEGIGPFTLPITVRGRRTGDRIKMNSGHFKYIKKIFNEWSVDSLARELLPIIIKDNCIRALYGSPLGYKNWFVKEG